VDPKFQTKYSLIIAGFGFSYAIIIGFFCFSFFRATLLMYRDSVAGANLEEIEQDWIFAFLIGFFLITALYVAILLAFARRMTHAVAGPVYAFNKVARELISGKDAKLKLREGDEFKYLNELSEDLKTALNQSHRRE
jgi:signal peptidase II